MVPFVFFFISHNLHSLKFSVWRIFYILDHLLTYFGILVGSDDESEKELASWEDQQIRKAVGHQVSG